MQSIFSKRYHLVLKYTQHNFRQYSWVTWTLVEAFLLCCHVYPKKLSLQKSHTKINRAMGKRGASFSKSMDFFLTKALKNSNNLIRTASLWNLCLHLYPASPPVGSLQPKPGICTSSTCRFLIASASHRGQMYRNFKISPGCRFPQFCF